MSAETITEVVINTDQRYEGNLREYFKILFTEPVNTVHPYHNIRHMLHVAWECYDGADFHQLNPREFRNLLIAALFHDFNHSGQMTGNDDLEIERALRALRKYILADDRSSLCVIEDLIKSTQFPHIVREDELSVSAKILRDSDMSQSFSTAWIQQIIFGLSKEMRVSPRKFLSEQVVFLSQIRFVSLWGKTRFEPLRRKRVKEVMDLLEILQT